QHASPNLLFGLCCDCRNLWWPYCTPHHSLYSSHTWPIGIDRCLSFQMIKLAAWAGMIGPLLFGIVVITLTILKYDFLLSLGWHPINDPTFDWPSGLALGNYGWIMTLTFLASGFMMTLFASGLRLGVPPVFVSRV